MNNFFKKEIIAHPLIVSSLGAVLAIAIGSVVYYVVATKPPAPLSQDTVAPAAAVTATGSVEPSENPDLSFAVGGRVAAVSVRVGDRVYRGETLASLDLSALSANRAQAQASLSAAQAHLEELTAPPRSVDVSAKQTAVAQAKQSLADAYSDVSDQVNDAFTKAYGAVHTYSDTLFSGPDTPQPSLVFQTADSSAAQRAIDARVSVNAEFASWQGELSSLSGTASESEREGALSRASAHLAVVRSYNSALAQALSGAILSSTFPSATAATANTNVGLSRDTVNGLISSISADTQGIASKKLSIQSAQNALDQALAGATSQQIAAAQASVDAAAAQVAAANAAIANAVIAAPFDGTVTSVQIKAGQIAAQNETAVSLSPAQALQITAYVSELDAARVAAGDHASVTLDAFGSSRVFSATVVSVDRSPTDQNGVPAYKIVLAFDAADPAISIGMTANVTISLTN